MNTCYLILLSSLAGCFAVNAQEVHYVVTERGPHHEVVGRVVPGTNQAGGLGWQTNSYVAMATGMNYWEDGWQPTRELIEPYPGGAIARHGQHKVILPNNIGEGGPAPGRCHRPGPGYQQLRCRRTIFGRG
jgi:hypothetical protein